jgi:hypothetical protein
MMPRSGYWPEAGEDAFAEADSNGDGNSSGPRLAAAIGDSAQRARHL